MAEGGGSANNFDNREAKTPGVQNVPQNTEGEEAVRDGMCFETSKLTLDQTEQKPQMLRKSECREEGLMVRETQDRGDKDIRLKTLVSEEKDERPIEPTHDTQKYIAEAAKEYEVEIMTCALEEITKSKKETLKYIEAEVEKHKAKVFERRIKITDEIAAIMQQVQDEEMNFVMAKLEKYKTETLKHIQEKALKQVNEAWTHLPEKLQKKTLEELSYLIKQILSPIVQKTEECIVDTLKDIMESKGTKQLADLHTKTIEENQKILNDDYRICVDESKKFLEEETQTYLEEVLENFDSKLTKIVQKEVEKLQTEASQHGNAGTEERQNIVHRLDKGIFVKVKKSKEEMATFLVNEARQCQIKALKEMTREAMKYVKEILGPKVEEQYKRGVEKIQRLVREAKATGQKVLETVLEHAEQQIASLIVNLMKKAMPSMDNSLKRLPENIMEFERTRMPIIDALSSMQNPVHQNPSQIFHRGSGVEQHGDSREGKDDIKNSDTQPEFRNPVSLKTLVSEKTPDIDTDEQWGSCPMMMMKNHRRYIGTVCRGKARVLQAPGSDVSLKIPDGFRGVYVMGVHTDVSKFKDVIDDVECFVSPVVEILHKNEDEVLKPESHTLKIPHCLRDASQLELIRVRRGRSSNNAPFQHISPKHKFHTNDDGYFVDHKHITIFSQKFSEFVCTSCHTTCKGTIKLVLYWKLNAWARKNVTTVQMKSFLCSPLFRIADFRRHLRDVQKTYELAPVEEGNVKIESQNFDPQNSYVTQKVYPAKTETNNWDPLCDDSAWKKERKEPMSEVMELDGCHNCRTLDPKEALVVNVKAEGICSDFHGNLDLVVHQEEPDSSGKAKEKTLKTQIFFTIKSNESSAAENALPSRQSSIQVDAVNEIELEKLLHQVAEKLTEKEDIRRLGLNLNLEHETIKTIFTNNPNSITTAAEEMLHTWYKRQDKLDDLCKNLGNALIKSNLNLIGRTVLDYKPTPRGYVDEDRKSSSASARGGIEEIDLHETLNKTSAMDSLDYAAAEVEESKCRTGEKHETGDETAVNMFPMEAKEVNTEVDVKPVYQISRNTSHETMIEDERESAQQKNTTKETYQVKSVTEVEIEAATGNGGIKKTNEAGIETETTLAKRKGSSNQTHDMGAEPQVKAAKTTNNTKETHQTSSEDEMNVEERNDSGRCDTEPQVQTIDTEPELQIIDTKPQVQIIDTEPQVQIIDTEPQVQIIDRN